jgi:NAD(P)-dependent dehydrogenase (short-subunit alcohol dehydrogenase family)
MFRGKVIVITGAGSGIGRALATQLSAAGARVALADVNEAALAETQALLPAQSESRIYRVDVSSRDAVQGFADQVQRDFGAAHFVINNAGVGVTATVENVEVDEIERVLSINLWGVIYGTKAFLPLMLKQREGCIVNISSVFGLVATPCNVAYTISKFGVRGFTETMWQELDGTGVRAVLVHPGGIKTNISKNPYGRHAGEYEHRLNAANLRQLVTPPEDCAREIIAGLKSGRNRLLVGSGAKPLFALSRLFPNSYGAIVKRKLGI